MSKTHTILDCSGLDMQALCTMLSAEGVLCHRQAGSPFLGPVRRGIVTSCIYGMHGSLSPAVGAGPRAARGVEGARARAAVRGRAAGRLAARCP